MAKSVMIVDDENETVEMVKDVLGTAGYDVIPAYSGMECLERLKGGMPSLIILDMRMPEMDGKETLKRIRNKDRSVPIVFLSAVRVSPGENMQLTAEYNLQGYLFKPITKSELVAQVSELIN